MIARCNRSASNLLHHHHRQFEHLNAKRFLMAESPSSITRSNPPAPNGSLPAEYQIRPQHLPVASDSPLSGIAAHPYRPRSLWYELWKSKLAFILFVGSTTLIYLDYQRTQRYKAQKALNAASELNEQKMTKK